ncbi:MAG: type VI secretion system tube protein Hcp [Luteolibacter sp.]|uniref:Hcp family type VI secretion system effector n=1 Tax=Luteolibacter sp. TaxID=1962973 RepID=UPI003266AE55
MNSILRTAATIGIACFSALLFHPTEARAQATTLQSFLELGDIKGEATTVGHKNQIEVISFGSGVELPAVQTGGGVGKPQFYEVTVTKNVDKASPLLSIYCVTGKITPTATLTTARINSAGVQDFFKIVLTNVSVTRVAAAGQSGKGGELSEQLSLGFQKIQWIYTTYNEAGAPTGTITKGFDLKSNTPF